MEYKYCNKYEKGLKFFLFFLSFTLLIIFHEKILIGKENYKIIWQIQCRLGEKNGDKHTTFFRVKDITFDKKSNFYVLDALRPAILCFDSSCNYYKTIELSKGKGPFEVIDPSILSISSRNEIILLDPKLRRVYFFNPTTKQRRTFKLTETYPVGAADDMKVDKFENLWIAHKDLKTNHALHIYNRDGKITKSFITVKPLSLGVSWPLHFTGCFTFFKDHIIFMKEIPYEIMEYSRNGSFIKKFQTEKSLLKPPEIIKQGSGFIISAWDKAEFIANIKNKYILSQIKLVSKNEVRYDLFNINTGKLIAKKSMQVENSLKLMSANDDLIYAVTESKGYPEILVINLKLE